MNKPARRPFYKFWPLWVVLVIVVGWPYVNDWAWDSAKQEAKDLITQFESKYEAQAKAQAGTAAPQAHAVTVEMSKLTCVAANSYYAPYWQLSAPYSVRLIQAFVWHGYGIDVPSAQSIKERGCGRTADGKYQFTGT
ncbi:MAG TPA: hypothetical protein VF472_11780 [Burkholderiaceae bacterium]